MAKKKEGKVMIIDTEGNREVGSRRRDYQINHRKIEDFIMESMLNPEINGMPTIKEISKGLNMSYHTVREHMQEMDLEMYRNLLKPFTGKILMRFAMKLAQNPHAKGVETWMKLIEGWTDKQEREHKVRIVNNTIPD